MPLSFRALFSSSCTLVVRRWKPLLTGIVLCALVSLFLQVLFLRKAGAEIGRGLGDLLGPQRAAELMMQMHERTGSVEYLAQRGRLILGEVQQALDRLPAGQGQEKVERIVRRIVQDMAPWLGGIVSAAILLLFFRRSYFLLLAHTSKTSLAILLHRSAQEMFRLLALTLWIFLRSFLWLPFVLPFIAFFYPRLILLLILAWIPALLLLPRFALASVILVGHREGITESARISFDHTKGYWGKILGNLFLVRLLLLVALWLLGMFSTAVGMLGLPLLPALLRSIATQASVAFVCIFLTELTQTVMAHPKRGEE